MTGAPIYLVSACASGEEFVSAFRRYADRNGVVFVPLADPLPSGRRGRFALTLVDGGVMIEGEAEVVSSARTPSVLYGRTGMTVKFLEPDELSKIVLGELEKARLVLKPPAPSVPPRPAEIPAAPRPKPPAPSGRIDAVNALAECVVIGDLSGLANDAVPSPVPAKVGSQKFVVPTIPNRPKGPTNPPTLGGIRPKSPTGPVALVEPNRPLGAAAAEPSRPHAATPPAAQPIAAARPKSPTVPPLPTSVGLPPPDKKLTAKVSNATTLGMAALDRRAGAPTPAAGATSLGVAPLDPASGAPKPPTPDGKIDLTATIRGTKPVTPPAGTAVASGPPPLPKTATPAAPLPIVQTPAPPIVAAAPPVVVSVETTDEPTDLSPIPQETSEPLVEVGRPKAARESRRTSIGVAVVPDGMVVLPATPAPRIPSEDEARDTTAMPAIAGVDVVDALGATLPPQPLRPSVVTAALEEPTPSGDWTLAVGDGGPTIEKRTPASKAAQLAADAAARQAADPAATEEPPLVIAAKTAPKGPPTGNWVIALDPTQPDGWTEPAKVPKPPVGEQPGPPVTAVSSSKPLDSSPKRAETSADDGPKVQIDPTLIEPLLPMPALDDEEDVAADAPVMAASGSSPMMPSAQPLIPSAQPLMPSATRPSPGLFSNGAHPVGASASFLRDSGGVANLSGEATSAVERTGHRRMIVIIAASAVAVALGIVLVLTLGKKPEPSSVAQVTSADAQLIAPPDPTGSGDDPAGSGVEMNTETGSGSAAGSGSADQEVTEAIEMPVIDDEGEPAPAVDAGVAAIAPTDCVVSVASTPAGAEIVIDKTKVGVTPAKLTLPCGVQTRLLIRKTRYAGTQRTITPTAAGQKPVRVALARVTFTVKVSSTPAGATITLGGKAAGVTPTTVKLPAFESSTLKLAKPGYAPVTQQVTPKQNSVTVHATLKKAAKRR